MSGFAVTAEIEALTLESFRRAATLVPAYQALLKETGVQSEEIKSLKDFNRLPVLDKRNTFQRFGVEQLCVDGKLGQLGSVLTSSGHSGVFAFGLNPTDTLPNTFKWIDDLLDFMFSVRSQTTLLINCLPMGVKVATQACTLAETSVRPDMAVGLVKAFSSHFAQIILVGEAAFIKHLLELGLKSDVDWKRLRIQVIVGEEPLAENARKYIERILDIDIRKPESGTVLSSMGVAEIGLNLFSEAPPVGPLVWLRRALHESSVLREAVLGPRQWVPSIFTYDPHRILVEFDDTGSLILTTLDPNARLPLIRYSTGDRGAVLRLPEHMQSAIEAIGVPWELMMSLHLVMIEGRGKHAFAGEKPVYPEAVKEGIYDDPEFVPLITANFRLISGLDRVLVRLQLAEGVSPSTEITARFRDALAHYVSAPFEVVCEAYESFGSGMALDYERKFDYLGR